MALTPIYWNGFESGLASGNDLGTISAGGNGITTGAKRTGDYGLDVDRSDNFQPSIPDIDLSKCMNIGFGFNLNTLVSGIPDVSTGVLSAEGSVCGITVKVTETGLTAYTANILGGTTTTIATAAVTLGMSTWHHFECSLLFKDTGGRVVVWINGALALDFTGDTVHTGRTEPTISQNATMAIYAGPGSDCSFDDLYVTESNSTTPEQLGDAKILPIRVNANGTTSQMVGSDADSTDNYLLVDEHPPAGADYVESDTIGNLDTYGTDAAIATGDTVLGVAVKASALNDDSGTRTLGLVVREGATETTSAGKGLPQTTAAILAEFWTTNPDTAAAWTPAEVNAAEIGIEVVT